MNKKRKVYLRADADQSIGFGHFIRSLALADMLKDEFDCTFFTQTPTKYQKAEVGKICKLVELPSDDTKFDIFFKLLKGDEIIVLDNYFFHSEYQKIIKEKGCKLICFGTNDRHYYADILFNFAETNTTIFSVEPYTQIKLGIDWTILRLPFRDVKINNEHKKRSIGICFGGTDQFALTEKCLNVIQTYGKFNEIHMIATDQFGKERIKSLRQKGVLCHLNITAQQIVDILTSLDCIITSASTITHESLACQIPVICGYYVDNQKKMYDYFCVNKLVLGISNLLLPDMENKLSLILNDLDCLKKQLNTISFNDTDEMYLSLFKSL